MFLIFFLKKFISNILFLIILYIYIIIFLNSFNKTNKNNKKTSKKILSKNTLFSIFNDKKIKNIF